MLNPVGNQEPITALLFAGNTLYAGVGSFLKVFDWSQGLLLFQQQVFNINKVHGIAAYKDNQYIVWGGNSYAIVRKTPTNETAIVAPERRCKDWIVDISWGSGGPCESQTDSLIYIQTAHNEVLEVIHNTGDILKTHRCDERSILYSGKLFISDEHRWAAGGTVFGGVVVWDLDTDLVSHTFNDHEGSIFDVAWSQDGSYLASCSDDRAIFVWSLSQNRAVAQGWGHTSRIWRLQFAASKMLISTAEDLTVRVWEMNKNDSQLNCIRIFSGHKGRNVWACALNDENMVTATGGGDGRIMLWDLMAADEALVADENEWDMQAEFGDRVRDCAVNSNGTCVIVTVDGVAWMWHSDGNWFRLETSLARMPLVKAFSDLFIVVTLSGQVTVLGNNGESTMSASLGHSVLGFCILSRNQIIVQTTPPESKYLVYDILAQKITADLEKPTEQSIMTCAALSNDLLCLGTRKGGLALYDLSTATPRLVSFEPKALGANDAITSIRFAAEPFVIATSRSTEYGNFSVPDLSPLLKNRARRRGSVEGFTETANGMVFWGFQNDLFNTWNASLEFEIASTNCGGSHRSWDFKILDSGEFRLCYVRSPRFVIYTTRAQSPKFKYTMLQAGTHGREIRGLEACPTNKRLVAMGSEDTLVSVGWINGNQIENATMIRNGHISGIQSLHWDPAGRYLFTGAGQGELVMWQVNTVGQAIFAHQVSRMPSAPGTDIYDLRVMDFSIVGDLIAVAYSDSSFRVWQFGKEWKLLLRQKYRECCLLNIDAIEVDGGIILLISSTDGHLAVYKLGDEDTSHADLSLRYQLHQSGIRDSVVLQRGPNKFVHYSGGDDNALRCIELTFEGSEVLVEDVFAVPNAHSSSVTALCITSDATKLLSTSADQKVKVWSLAGELLFSRFSDVSDTGVLMEHGGRVVAGGLGLEFFDIN